MTSTSKLVRLHSVRFRNKGYKRKRLLTPDREEDFLNFLVRALGADVFVISTGLGLDVYYLADEDYSKFIAKNLWIFRPDNESNDAVSICETHSGEDVLEYFNTVVSSLSGHPQLFLSCCKKLISKFNAGGIDTSLNGILYNCFDEHLNRLSKEENVPFASKIAHIRAKTEKPFLRENNLKQLADQLLAEDHIN